MKAAAMLIAQYRIISFKRRIILKKRIQGCEKAKNLDLTRFVCIAPAGTQAVFALDTIRRNRGKAAFSWAW